MPIDVYAELACPFTHLALRRVVERRRDLGRTTPRLRVHPWPLELVNGEPNSASRVAREVAALREQISPNLFGGFDSSAFPRSSMPGFRLAEAAYAVDDDTGERVSLALRHALFDQGRDVADAGVLAEIASSHDLEPPDGARHEAVCDGYEEGKARGVEGSPHFFVAGESAFCPMLDIQTDDDGAFCLALDEPAVRDLLDRWLATAT